MEMTEVFEKLKNLQNVLVEKYDLEKKIEDSPKQLESQDELLARLKKEYIEKNKSYEDVKADIERLKGELAEAEALRESGEKSMDSITSHREYEALDRQIAEATEREASVRKDLQREEKKFAELDDSLRIDEAMISSQEADLNQSRAELSKQIDEYKNHLSELEKEEADVIPGLDPEIVYKFQRIIQRNSEGIVAVRNGVCNGCHMILPGQFANEVRDGEKILFCPYCSRILFYQETADGEEEFYSTLDETGSLADFDDEFADEIEDEGTEENETDADLDDEKSLSFSD